MHLCSSLHTNQFVVAENFSEVVVVACLIIVLLQAHSFENLIPNFELRLKTLIWTIDLRLDLELDNISSKLPMRPSFSYYSKIINFEDFFLWKVDNLKLTS